MHLHALDFMIDEQQPPAVVHIMVVRQKLKIPLDHARQAIRLDRTQPEPVLTARTSGSIPKLAQDL